MAHLDSTRPDTRPGAHVRWLLAMLCALCAAAMPAWAAGYELNRLGVPRFVNTNYIDVAKIAQISRFRSSSGHDYSDAAERCRSMKHYFIAPDASTAIVAPVAGTVSMLRADFVGTQVHITSELYPDFSFIIFHVALARPLVLGERIAEGQVLGTHVGRQTWSDIAVSVNASDGWRLVSYFDTLSDSAFAVFQARGVASRAQMAFTRAQRDAAPYQCVGQDFSKLPVAAETELVTLSAEPVQASVQLQGPLSAQTMQLLISPPAVATGITGSVFVAAMLPPAMGGGIFLLSPTQGWVSFTDCTNAHAVLQGWLFRGFMAIVVAAPSDLTVFKGTTLFVGYALGSTVAGTCASMLAAGTFAAVHTLQ